MNATIKSYGSLILFLKKFKCLKEDKTASYSLRAIKGF
jgi:hypothetical protein